MRRSDHQAAERRLLRQEWSAGEVTDALWEASSPISYQTLVVESGWEPARYGEWLVWVAQSFLASR